MSVALLRIVKSREEKERLLNLAEREDLSLQISLKANPERHLDLKEKLPEYLRKYININ